MKWFEEAREMLPLQQCAAEPGVKWFEEAREMLCVHSSGVRM